MTVGYVDVARTLAEGGVTGEVQKAYLAAYQRAQKEVYTQTFAGALAELRADPNSASIFTGAVALGAAAAAAAAAAGGAGGAGAGGAGGEAGQGVAVSPSGRDIDPPRFAFAPRTIVRPDGSVLIVGKVTDQTPFINLRVNGHWAFVDNDGNFVARVLPGERTDQATLTVTDMVGNVTEQRLSLAEAAGGDGVPGRAEAGPGRRIALMFPVSNYEGAIPDLGTPAADVQGLSQVLGAKFGFETRVVPNGSKSDIIGALMQLGKEIGEYDQVVIYYAGHGYAMADTGVGYWLPADAETTSARNWISNEDVARLLHRMPAHQIMLIADSCYSGAFAGRNTVTADAVAQDPAVLAARRAVVTMSSGGEEPVMDGNVNSPFAESLMRRLGEVDGSTLGNRIFSTIQQDVTAQTPQTPHYGSMNSAGHDSDADILLQTGSSDVPAGDLTPSPPSPSPSPDQRTWLDDPDGWWLETPGEIKPGLPGFASQLARTADGFDTHTARLARAFGALAPA